MRIEILQRAAAELEEAMRWWQLNHAASADLLVLEFTEEIERLKQTPFIGQTLENEQLAGFYMLHFKTAPYRLYYRVVTPEHVQVVAIWHTRRDSPRF
jgi:plasmid stabilization system protein ParE